MNFGPLRKKVAALSDGELAAAATAYLDEDTATLHAAPYDDLHYRYVLLTEYQKRIPEADLVRVERVLGRVDHERQTREPHRVLGGVVPPLRDEVTVESVSRRPAGEALTRTLKIELLGTYIADGSKLASGGPRRAGDVIRRGDPRTPEERWRDDVSKALEQVDAPAAWSSLIVPTDTSTPSMTRAIELLGVLVCRIEAGKPLDLTDSHRNALATMVTLVVWADHLASLSNGNYNARTWERRDYEAFLTELTTVLDAAERYLSEQVDRDSLLHALTLVRTHMDIDGFVPRLNHRMFHAACAMWALAWWMSDALQDVFTIGHTPCATFREARASRAELVGRGHLSCPRCGGEVSFSRDQLRIIELPMANWSCASCNISGLFPEKTVPESPWARSPDSDSDPNNAPEADAGDIAGQMDHGDAAGPSASVAMDAVYALNRAARSLLTYLHGAHLHVRGSAFTLPFSEEVQKSTGLDYPSFKQAVQRLDERGLAKRVGQEVTSSATGVQAAEDPAVLDRLLPVKTLEDGARTVLSMGDKVYEANRKARRLLAFLHEWSMKGASFRVGPCDETTQATGLEGEDYKRAAERLLRKDLAKHMGTGYWITITTDGVRVAEDEAALDYDLPIGDAVQPRVLTGDNSMATTTRIFISHAGGDAKLAKALIHLVEAGLEVPTGAIRCTSVDGYKLEGGDDAPQVLRENLAGCAVVLGVLTRTSVSSSYVLMELGAAWAFKKRAIPLIGLGATFGDLPGPFKDIHALRMEHEPDMSGLITTLAKETGFAETHNLPKITAALKTLTETITASGVLGVTPSAPFRP